MSPEAIKGRFAGVAGMRLWKEVTGVRSDDDRQLVVGLCSGV